MAATYTFAVSASPATTPIVTQSYTRRVIIGEDPSVANYPTTDYYIYRPLSNSPRIQRLSGSSFVLDSPSYWPANTTIGYISGVSGSTTFQQDEQGF